MLENTLDLLTMGKHGVYVWSAYGLSGLALAWLICDSLVKRRRMYKKLYKRFSREVEEDASS